MVAIPFWNQQHPASYPAASIFGEDFAEAAYLEAACAQQPTIAPIALYLKLPACDRGSRYLDATCREMQKLAPLHGHRRVRQLHWAGGVPSYLEPAELTQLMYNLASCFELDRCKTRDYSIEVDPCRIDESSIALLKGLGFNRISIGIGDSDPQIPRAVGRAVAAIRDYDFDSLNFDFMYGSPQRSRQRFDATLDALIGLSPDRITCYCDGFRPDRPFGLINHTSERLGQAGYEHIGMDHFARYDDELCTAAREGKLQRNFQGYSRSLAQDLIGIGASSISQIGNCHSQNEGDPDRYAQRLEAGLLPVVRGLRLNTDDLIRRHLIQSLCCLLRLDIPALERQFCLSFESYFRDCLDCLRAMERHGLVRLTPTRIEVTPQGRSALRHICRLFDRGQQIEKQLSRSLD